jgi:hypothetical protein
MENDVKLIGRIEELPTVEVFFWIHFQLHHQTSIHGHIGRFVLEEKANL